MSALKSLALLLLVPLCLTAQQTEQSSSLQLSELTAVIPQPASTMAQVGDDFLFNTATRIVARTEEQKQAAMVFTDLLERGSGVVLKQEKSAPASNFVLLEKDRKLPQEHYRLEVNSNRIIVHAASAAGWTYGLQTVRQLLPPGVEDKSAPITSWSIPALTITDGPEFGWRGLMLGV